MRWAVLLVTCGCDVVVPLSRPACMGDSTYVTLAGTNPNHRYKTVSENSLTWQVAEQACVADGAHLATPRTLGEVAALQVEIRAALENNAWIGVARNSTDPPDAFHFVTGEPAPSFLWESGQPDNEGGIGEYAGLLDDTELLADDLPSKEEAYQCECDGIEDTIEFDFP